MSNIPTASLQAMLDDAYEAIYVTDLEHNLLYANRVAVQMCSALPTSSPHLGEKCYQALLGRDTPCPFCKISCMTDGDFLVRDFTAPSGQVFQLRGKLLDWGGVPAHIEYVRNITRQDKAEKRSAELAAQQSALYEHIGVGMCLYRRQGGEMCAVLCNKAYRQLLQLPDALAEGQPIGLHLQNFSLADRQALHQCITQNEQPHRPFHRVCRVQDAHTGLPRSVLMNLDCTAQADGLPLCYVSAYDVTEWAEQENQLHTMLGSISGGVAQYLASPDGVARALTFSDGLPAMHGYARQEYQRIAQTDARDLVYPDDRARLQQDILTALHTRQSFSSSCRVLHKQKGYIWINISATPAGVDADGQMRYTAAFTNVSYQFALYQRLLDNSENAVIVTDRTTREVYFTNLAARRILAAVRAACPQRDTCPAQQHPQGKHEFPLCSRSELLPSADSTPRKVKLAGRTYQVHTHPVQWLDRPATAQYFSDISEEIALQEQLTMDEERYRLVVEESGIALLDYDARTGKLYANDRIAQYALAPAESGAPGFCPGGGRFLALPQDEPLLRRFFADLEQQHSATARLRLQLQSGTYRWTALSALDVRAPGGHVVRRLGFFRDVDEVTRQYEDLKIRYDYELTRQNSFENGVVERMLLDLTDDRVIRAANSRSAQLDHLIGIRTQDLLAARLSRSPDPAEQAQLRQFMNRDALLQAYYTGATPALQMRARLPGGDERYFLTTAQLAKNPGNSHIIAFIETRDNDRAVMESTLMRRLLETNYESAVVIHAATGRIKIGVSAREAGFCTDVPESYDQLVAQNVAQHVLPAEQQQVCRQMALATLRQKLQTATQHSGRVTVQTDGQPAYKMWTAAYFDEKREYILLTIANVTAVYQRDLQNAQTLRDALESAKVASQAKSVFLARMSHEIRTPITTVSGVLELIRIACQNDRIDRQRLLERVETADAANKYLLTLINDILDISKIEKNELRLHPVPVDVRQLIPPMCAMLRPAAEKKGVELILQRKTAHGNWYCMDATRVQQILMNLLNNAIKFTPAGGSVTFTGESEPLPGGRALLRFVVSDTGVGISPAFLPDVFEPFRQEYTDSSSGYGGTGIGLAISRRLARMMGGDITVQSVKGRGSTFVATLRLATAAPQAAPQPSAQPARPMLSGLHVLLCEDNKVNQAIVQKLLEAGGCTVSTADDGLQAVQRFAAMPPGACHLILMDIRMPGLDGLEATRRIRALPRPDAQRIPIVAMSANAYEEDRQMSLAAGMNDHLSKPVDTALLYRTIRRYAAAGSPPEK